MRSERTDPLINGALISMGALGIIDNVVVHWILELHRAIPGPYAVHAEIAIIVISAGLLVLGLYREVRARTRG